MTNMMDYINWRGDILFSERGFNEIDNIIFSELSYIEMDDIVPDIDSDEDISLADLAVRYSVLERKHGDDPNHRLDRLLYAAAESERFRDVRVGSYIHRTDQDREMQFSAVTFFLNNYKYMYVAYRGTDMSLVGWKEDFNICYLDKIPAQDEAVEYLNRIAAKRKGNIIIGGHSKGGNLSVYAGAFCKNDIKDRIMCIYSNDGPGFNSRITSSQEYLEILSKIQIFIAESSIIGLLMSNNGEMTIIEGTGSLIDQHDPFNWSVEGTEFVRADEKSHSSVLLDKAIRIWLDSLTLEDREKFFNIVFDILESSGAETITEIQNNRSLYHNAIIKAVKELRDEDKKTFNESILKFASASKDIIWQDFMKNFDNSNKEESDS